MGDALFPVEEEVQPKDIPDLKMLYQLSESTHLLTRGGAQINHLYLFTAFHTVHETFDADSINKPNKQTEATGAAEKLIFKIIFTFGGPCEETGQETSPPHDILTILYVTQLINTEFKTSPAHGDREERASPPKLGQVLAKHTIRCLGCKIKPGTSKSGMFDLDTSKVSYAEIKENWGNNFEIY
ncbi:hypothetical protein llap_1804 [Limosa lapponica baueri]|uniref:Uncharacterized protein n=1 Tax=Limosa lapponica baueri TaxID=1758121 RepID=A0A2I0UPA6_LIMLA|nr:hypothetical protein llap_1804 [Limosa lapponica baueri]